MTHNREKFRKGYEKLDEVIRWADKRANDSQVKLLAVDAGLGEVSRFITEASLDQVYTIESLSQKSQILLNKDSNTAVDLPDSENSIDELVRLQTPS